MKRVACLAARLAVGLVLLLLSGPALARESDRFALVLGNNSPEQAPTTSLRYADDDAVAMHRLLEEAGVDSTVLVTLDADTRALNPEFVPSGAARVDELERAVKRLSERIREANEQGRTTELLVFYSGHGDVDGGEGYVVLEDGRLTRTRLYELLAHSGASKNHVFIDACKSYFLAFEKGPGGSRVPYARSLFGDAVPGSLTNTGFVLSTSSDRESHEWERYQAGILSHELRSALRGAADADLDGRVTYAELSAFLTAANRQIPNERFRPDFLVRAPDRNARTALLSWSTEAAALRLRPGPLGHVYVETAQGVRLLDAHPAAGQALALHLPSQRPLFIRQDDESAELVLTTRAPVVVARLDPSTPEVAQRGALHLAFERLFSAPFGSDDVTAFLRAEGLRARAQARSAGDADVKAESTSGSVLRYTAAGVTFGAVATGLTLNALSAVSFFATAHASQERTLRENERRKSLNLASVVAYAVAGGAGITWAVSALSSSPGASVSVAAAPSGGIACSYLRNF